MAEKLELSLKVSKEEAQKGLNDVTQKILELKKYQQDLNKDVKAGSITQAHYAKEMMRTKMELSEYTSKQKENIQIIKSQDGSMKNLRAELALNRTAYRELSKEERENAEIGGKLLKVIQQQDAELKDLNKSIGNAQDNVGNYKDEVKAALEESGLMNKEILGTGISMNTLKDGIGKATGSFKSLRTAMIAVPIMALVAGVTALFNYFTKTERGAQNLRVIMAGLGAVMGKLSDYTVGVGESLYNMVTNPKEAFIKLGDIIKQNVLNRIEALGMMGKAISKILSGDVLEGFKDLGEAGLQAYTGVEDLIGKVTDGAKSLKAEYDDLNAKVKEGISLAERENALKVAKREFQLEEIELETKISDLKKQAADQSASAADREKALQDAIAVQNQLFEKRKALAKEEYDIKVASNGLSESSEEDLDAEYQLKADLLKLDKQQLDLEKELHGQLTGFQKQQADQKKRDSEAEEKRRKEQSDKELKEQEEKLKKLQEQEATYQAEMEVREQERYEASLQTEEERSQYALDKQYEREYARIQALGLTKEQEKDLLLELDKKYADESEKIAEESAEKKKEIDRLAAESKEQGIKDTLNVVSEAIGKETKAGKATAIAAGIMDTLSSSMKAFKSAADIPVIGHIIAPIQAAATLALGMKNVQKISAVQTPTPQRFAEGGWIGGRLHQNGGTTINAESGEFIVNRRTMANPQMAAAIQQMNASNGGATPAAAGITEERIAQIAASVQGSIPVVITESNITDKQKKVQTRESKFSI